jgi:uncharacterized small protein (DUF1192 family)
MDNEDENEKYVRELNETAERDAELAHVKAQLWRRIAAVMTEISRLSAHERLSATITAKPIHPGERAE